MSRQCYQSSPEKCPPGPYLCHYRTTIGAGPDQLLPNNFLAPHLLESPRCQPEPRQNPNLPNTASQGKGNVTQFTLWTGFASRRDAAVGP